MRTQDSRQPSLAVVLMCRNRVHQSIRAIEAILRQSDADFEFVVSDNSVDLRAVEAIRASYPWLNVIHRGGHLSQFEHMRMLIQEATCDYLLVTHDDDVLSEKFISLARFCIARRSSFGILLSGIIPYKSPVADKFLSVDSSFSKANFQPRDVTTIIRDYLLGRYCGDIYAISMAVFNVKIALRCLDCFNDSGHLADACFIIKLSSLGGALVNHNSVGFYEVSDDSVSRSLSILDSKLFLRFLVREGFSPAFRREVQFFKLRARYQHLKHARCSERYNLLFFIQLIRFLLNPFSMPVLLRFAKRKIQAF